MEPQKSSEEKGGNETQPRTVFAIISLLVVFLAAFSLAGYFYADSKIKLAHEASEEAKEEVEAKTEENAELRRTLVPEIDELRDEVVKLELANTSKDMEIARERNVSKRARSEADELRRRRLRETTEIAEADNQQLVVKTLDLIKRAFPQVADPSYSVYDNKDFVADRPAADAFAFGLTEALVNRSIIVKQLEDVEALTNQLNLSKEQKDNLDKALNSEKEAHGKTEKLLGSEIDLGKANVVLVEKLGDEVKAWEDKYEFNFLKPKCGFGGMFGYDVANSNAALGVGVICGWMFQ